MKNAIMKRTLIMMVLFFAFFGGLLTLRASAQAVPRSVLNTDNAGPGSLRQAILDAGSGDTINFTLSNCPCTITLTSGDLVINKDLTILGLGADQLTISGNNTSRVFTIVQGVTANLSGVTLTNGNGNGLGNTLLSGGAILNESGTLNLNLSVISGNHVENLGGGILNYGTAVITDSVISRNTADLDGGGMSIWGGTTKIRNSTICGNTAPMGGGLSNYQGNLEVTNATISGNTGTGIQQNGYAFIASSTITNNSGNLAGGVVALSNNTTVYSTIIAGNVNNTTIPDVSGRFLSRGNNLIGNVGVDLGYSAYDFGPMMCDQIGFTSKPLDPKLGPLQNNGGQTPTQALMFDSPALDRGSNSYAFFMATPPFIPSTDQRGQLRRQQITATVPCGDGTDIGAYEMQAPCPIVKSEPFSFQLPYGIAGRPYRVQFVGSNSPYNYSVTGLPDGLRVIKEDAGGETFSGIPTKAGSFTAAVSETDANGCIVSRINYGIIIAKGQSVLTWNNPADIAYGTPLSATQLNATANASGSFVYTPPLGTVLRVGVGLPLTVTFTPTDSNSFTTASKTVYLNVLKATPVITWNPPRFLNSGTFLSNAELNATTNVVGTFNYSPLMGTSLYPGAINLTTNFTPADTLNYNFASKSVAVTVLNNYCGMMINPTILAAMQRGVAYSQSLSASSSGAVFPTYYFSLVAGTLPPGTQLQNGTLSGTPTTAGTYTFTIKVSRGGTTCEAARTYTIIVP